MKKTKNLRVSNEFWEALEDINKDWGTPKTEITRKLATALNKDKGINFERVDGWKKKKRDRFEFRI